MQRVVNCHNDQLVGVRVKFILEPAQLAGINDAAPIVTLDRVKPDELDIRLDRD